MLLEKFFARSGMFSMKINVVSRHTSLRPCTLGRKDRGKYHGFFRFYLVPSNSCCSHDHVLNVTISRVGAHD